MTNVQATPVSSGAPAGITASGKGTRVSEDRSDELHAMVMQQLDEDQAQDHLLLGVCQLQMWIQLNIT